MNNGRFFKKYTVFYKFFLLIWTNYFVNIGFRKQTNNKLFIAIVVAHLGESVNNDNSPNAIPGFNVTI